MAVDDDGGRLLTRRRRRGRGGGEETKESDDESASTDATDATVAEAATTTASATAVADAYVLNYTVIEAASLVHASVSKFGAAPLLFYIEWNAQGADLDVEFALTTRCRR
jgi:hypothetical protein